MIEIVVYFFLTLISNHFASGDFKNSI